VKELGSEWDNELNFQNVNGNTTFKLVGFSLVCERVGISMNAGIRQRICHYVITGNAFWEVQPCLHALGNSCCAF